MKKLFNAFVIFCLSVLILSCSGNFGSMQKGTISIDSKELIGAVARAGARGLEGRQQKVGTSDLIGGLYGVDTGVYSGYTDFYSSLMKNYSDFISERLKSNVDIEFTAAGDYSVYRKETVSMDFSKFFDDALPADFGGTEIDYNENYNWLNTTKYETGNSSDDGIEILAPIAGDYPEPEVGSEAGEEDLILGEFENLDSRRIQEILSIKGIPVGSKLKLKVSVRFYIQFDATQEEFLTALGLNGNSTNGQNNSWWSQWSTLLGFDGSSYYSSIMSAMSESFLSIYDELKELDGFSVTFECESDTITIAPGDNEITLYAKLIGDFGEETIEIPLNELDENQSVVEETVVLQDETESSETESSETEPLDEGQEEPGQPVQPGPIIPVDPKLPGIGPKNP